MLEASTADPADWVADLAAGSARREQALTRLHALLLRAARAETRRRGPRLGIAGTELDDLAHQAADDALLAILGKLEQFRGESRFTTWVYKFVVLEVAHKTTRHAWRRSPPATSDEWGSLPAHFGFEPSQAMQWREMFAELRRGVEQELTERQRRVFESIVLQEVPLDVLVVELDSTRGAIYKTLFDARRKLRAHLVANGYMNDDGSVTT